MRIGEGSSAAIRGAAGLEYVRTLLVPQMETVFPGQVKALETPFEQPQVQVARDAWLPVARWLKEQGFNMLMDVGGVDYLPREPRFEVVYHFMALPRLWRLRVRVPVDEEDPVVPSVAELWPAAAAPEREVFDLFGIRFTGHPNLTRILMPDNWEGHPLRKDYPLRGPRDLDSDVPVAERNRFFAPRLPGGLAPPPGSGDNPEESLGSAKLTAPKEDQ